MFTLDGCHSWSGLAHKDAARLSLSPTLSYVKLGKSCECLNRWRHKHRFFFTDSSNCYHNCTYAGSHALQCCCMLAILQGANALQRMKIGDTFCSWCHFQTESLLHLKAQWRILRLFAISNFIISIFFRFYYIWIYSWRRFNNL